MTLQDIEKSTAMFLFPADVAEITGESPQYIRNKAKNGTLEYKCIRTGNRTKILRTSFLAFMKGENQ